MDEKELARKNKEYLQAKTKALQDKQNSDRSMHSEDKGWKVDYNTGSLTNNGGK